MYSMSTNRSDVTWKNVLANPFILSIMAIPLDSNSVLALISTSFVLVVSSLPLLHIRHVSFSVSIPCGIIFALGCSIGGFALSHILERLFPNFPTVNQWEWIQWVPSAFGNLAILVWVIVVLNISPVSRSLVIGTGLVAAAAGYALTLDAVAVRETLIFDVPHEITDWEQGIAYLLNGNALVVWSRLVIRGLVSANREKLATMGTLFVGICIILLGIIKILK